MSRPPTERLLGGGSGKGGNQSRSQVSTMRPERRATVGLSPRPAMVRQGGRGACCRTGSSRVTLSCVSRVSHWCQMTGGPAASRRLPARLFRVKKQNTHAPRTYVPGKSRAVVVLCSRKCKQKASISSLSYDPRRGARFVSFASRRPCSRGSSACVPFSKLTRLPS